MSASMIDPLISIISGIFSILFGFRILGPKDGRNQNYDALYKKWIKHLRWLGPLVIVFGVIQIALAAFDANAADTSSSGFKTEIRKKLDNAISEKGAISKYDFLFESDDGYGILIPAGYTYSKPVNTPFSLFAVRDADTLATPAMSVLVAPLSISAEEYLLQLKNSMSQKNKTTKFSNTSVHKNGATNIQRTTYTSVREHGAVKGIIMVASKSGKIYTVNLGTRENLYEKYTVEFEKISASFALR